MRLGVVVASVAALAVAQNPDHPPKRERPAAGVTTGSPAPVAVTGADPDGTAGLVLAVFVSHELERIDRERIEAEHVAEYLAAVEAERVAQARRIPTAPSASRGGGGTCGGATNGADAYIGRESGGNPDVWNTGGSGAWGCYQIMPGTWAGSCSDLGAHGSADAAAQAACASRLPLSAWR